jgi:isopenicillin-N N-acyltransferase like protein
MLDAGFPLIEYSAEQSPRQWGRGHGEAWREAIRELVSIRTHLMREKNPALTTAVIEPLAAIQWSKTADYAPELADELLGIAEGSGLSITELVILNNYTDFRDIEVTEQGCSTIYVHRGGNRIAGQTWDMHGSAKRFMCCLKIPASAVRPASIVLSLVGCIGMMGFSARGSIVGVNNINTDGARPGILWPVIIRRLIDAQGLEQQRSIIQAAPLTSGRCFLLADRSGVEFWEAMPGLSERVSSMDGDQLGGLFHTNHCLGTQAVQREVRESLSSTTHDRYRLLEKKLDMVSDLQSAWELLNDHEGYPRSICSNYQTTSIDPSVTCGGAVGDLQTGKIRCWRGDKLYDAHFVEYQFLLDRE